MMKREEKRRILIGLIKKMKADDNLPLKKSANNLVFGEGDVDAKVLFIGEGPGYWEDQKGLPFVGNAGRLLNELLETIGLSRKEVFITNVVHHRPPNNRDPEQFEIKAYQPYLDKIIEVINPKIIVTLGRFSMAKFLEGVTITQVHGKIKKAFFNGREIIVIPMYHPAAGLRNSEIKKKLFEDFKVIALVLKDVLNKNSSNGKQNILQERLI
ncbi:MAG: uracil-DNA glycosylase [Patescibacteria group bacterium]|nr:uracil-DNA glycosylase [Patescibacteria group bacterium]